MTAKEWVKNYETKGIKAAFDCIADFVKPFERLGVRPSLAIAQFLQESYKGGGKWSGLFLNQNNLHGIKSDTGALLPTQEEIAGELIDVNDRFGVYLNIDAGIPAYCKLMCGSRYFKVRAADTWQGAVKVLGRSGYATHSGYAEAVRYWVERYELWQYDTFEFKDREAEVFNTTRFRDKGERVETVQLRLSELDYDIEITKIYDLTTFEMVNDFQAKAKLLRDGVCGINTYLALEAAIAAKYGVETDIKIEPIEKADISEKVTQDSPWIRFLKIESENKKESEV